MNLLDYVRRAFDAAQAPKNAPTAPVSEGVVDRAESTLDIVDIRTIANPHRVDGKGKPWSVLGKRRPWSQVRGITLHQTACVLGERPQRWATVGAHYGVMRSGRVVEIYDPDLFVVHGNGWNNQTIGIEIDGLFAGVEGDLATVWDDPSTKGREQPNELTDAQVVATCALIDKLYLQVLANGGKLSKLVSHRQSSESRRNDPGSAVWERIALPMMAKRSLSDGGPGFKLGDGRPNPREWNPSRTERY